jgi:Tfp pilus assembly protein PilF
MQRQDYVRAEENLQEALSMDPESLEAWTLQAHAQFSQKLSDEAIASYERALEIRSEPMDNAVYLRLGQLLLDGGKPEQLERAKQIFLKACTSFSTASSWLGVGIACYKRGQYDQAEEALVEANIADNQNGVVWAYICLVCMQLRRDDEADRALQFALQRGVDQASVLVELGSIYVDAGKPGIAEGALRRALLLREDATVRIGLADAISAQGKEDDAIREYQKVVEQGVADDEQQMTHATEQLVSLLNQVNRPEEAKKYAKKLGQ